VTAVGPPRWSLRATGVQAVVVVAICVGVPVSAASPTDLTVRPPPVVVAAVPAAAARPAPPAPPEPAAGTSIPASAAAEPAPPPPEPVAVAPRAAPAIRRPAPQKAISPAPAASAMVAPSKPASGTDGATVIRIGAWSTTVERGDQAVIDRCRATLFWGPWPADGPGTAWLAGHDHCGFGFWAGLPIGTTVSFSGPHGAGSYVIVGRTWMPGKGGPSRGLIHDDLILQTCQGLGTALTYGARRD